MNPSGSLRSDKTGTEYESEGEGSPFGDLWGVKLRTDDPNQTLPRG